VEKVLLRRISLKAVTGLLYVTITILIVTFYSELKWASELLPGYFKNEIRGISADRILLRDAENSLFRERHPERATVFLEQLLHIDPMAPEAYFMLGKSNYMLKNYAEAEQALRKTIELDASLLDAYLGIAKIKLDQNRLDETRKILIQGRDYFQNRLGDYQANEDPNVEIRFNKKAAFVFNSYQQSLTILQEAIQRFDKTTAPGQN
jgi:tetratricopeptide (TPR) repeat protein